jgi:UDP:flavonoid glycosyltransferase YjiC (YdhE family)
MSHIAICMLPEPGHILPTIRVAKLLEANGHAVTYITVPRYENFFRALQISYHSVFSDELSENHTDDIYGGLVEDRSLQLLSYYFNAGSNELSEKLFFSLRNLRFELLLCDTIIVRYLGNALRNALSQVIVAINIGLPDRPWAYKYGMPEVVLCPGELELPQSVDPSQTNLDRLFYAEPSVFIQRQEIAFPWGRIASDRPIVYCSLGTQYIRYPQALEILKDIVHAFSDLPDYQLVLVAGNMFSRFDPESLPVNVVIVRTAPQIDVLKRSKLFITHGGQGGIKEAVMNGVAMLVIPFDTDQPRNAARIFYHRLGRYCLPSECTPEVLKRLVRTMLETDDMRSGLTHMQHIFCNREAQAPSVQFIEQILAGGKSAL